MCIAGNYENAQVEDLVNKWYGDIPQGEKYLRKLPVEPQQNDYREETIERAVPADAFYYGFRMPGKEHPDYYTADLLSDLLGRGKSSRLYVKLKKELNLVSEISAYILGSHDEGMLMISGKLNKGESFEQLDTEIWKIIEEIRSSAMLPEELTKIKNKVETTKVFTEQGILSKAMNLSLHELLGDANGVNLEQGHYNAITASDIQNYAKDRLVKSKCAVLKVKAK